MKLLRETIRRLLVENQEYFDKLIKLLSSERIEDINNALELAITLGYIKEYNYKKRTFLFGPPRHHWYVYGPCDRNFLHAIGFPKNDLTANTQVRRHRTPGGFQLILLER